MAAAWVLASLTGCVNSDGRTSTNEAQSCMSCHNGAQQNDYSGPGLEDPHPFGAAANLTCTTCHGGNGGGSNKLESHIPAPPQIGDDANLIADRTAYFNRLTLTGIDKFPDYTVGGVTYSALDYLQFINPGDLRVVSTVRSCGQCHAGHVDDVSAGLLATSAGVFSGATYAAGVDNEVAANAGIYENTGADLGFRAVLDPTYLFDPATVGPVAELLEFPVVSVFNRTGGNNLFQNAAYDSVAMAGDLNADNSVVTGSYLAAVYREQVAFTCGDCHLGSAGANNRYGDFRSSGCTACHMPYSLDGRSRSGDPNVNLLEPLDPDDIEAPERAHVKRHLITSIAKTLPSGEFVQGMDDYTCAGCHQGSNRTVMQYWGIRLDQNQDVRLGDQYPANPVTFQDTSGDTRLFDPVAGNNTFNGRNRRQYLRFEDYDGDGLDDTPADVHYDAGLGCIDCHGSYDLHGSDAIVSRMEQAVAIRCESCHGSVGAYASTAPGLDYDDQPGDLAMDSKGNPLRHVTRDAQGDYYLTSRLTGATHFVPQTRDTVVDTGASHPGSGDPVFSAKASYAMGRDDGNSSTGIGPQQTGGTAAGFSHSDNLSCAACHSSWTNTCIGCHLEGEYNTNPNNFSNITGDRIAFRERVADFVYQSPVMFQLGVNASNQIAPMAANTETFFRYRDLNGTRSDVFAFTDRNGGGNNQLQAPFPSLSHNAMMPHSIRGKIDTSNEGPRYCVSCHLTDNAITNWGAEYDVFRTALSTSNFSALDFNMLQTHIGRNPGNQLDSPMFVHMAAGLGTGLFLFDEDGCAINPLDDNTNRAGCEGTSPQARFLVNGVSNVALNLDAAVNLAGESQGSSNHALLNPGAGPLLRDGAANERLAGPLGARLLRLLTDPTSGLVLNSWLDADGNAQGAAAGFIGP